MLTQSNFKLAHQALSDKRNWKDIVADQGWDGLHRAVKSGTLPRPVVSPICKQVSGGVR